MSGRDFILSESGIDSKGFLDNWRPYSVDLGRKNQGACGHCKLFGLNARRAVYYRYEEYGFYLKSKLNDDILYCSYACYRSELVKCNEFFQFQNEKARSPFYKEIYFEGNYRSDENIKLAEVKKIYSYNKIKVFHKLIRFLLFNDGAAAVDAVNVSRELNIVNDVEFCDYNNLINRCVSLKNCLNNNEVVEMRKIIMLRVLDRSSHCKAVIRQRESGLFVNNNNPSPEQDRRNFWLRRELISEDNETSPDDFFYVNTFGPHAQMKIAIPLPPEKRSRKTN